MARVVGHLSLEELQAGYRGSGDGTLARHYQVIWLLAQGRTCPEVAGLTSFALRWVEQLLARYNAFGPRSLGDRRRGNGAAPTVLTAAMLAAVRERVRRPPDDGGVWTARKVATFMAAELGRRVAEQRGWEALRAIGWTIQSPRPQHAEAATPEEQEAFKKRMARPVCKLIFDAAVSVCANVSGIGALLPAQMELRATRSSQNSRRLGAIF
jgi:transposase